MVIPAEGDQIVRIVIPTPAAGLDMMNLESIVERTAVHSALAVAMEDMTPHLGAHSP
jgi:hypothetical protein